MDIRGPGTTRVARTGDLVATDHGTFIYPVEFDFEGETFDGEVEVQLEGNLISLGEWLYWRPKEAERMISDPVFSGSVDGINLYNANSKQQHLVEWAIRDSTLQDSTLPQSATSPSRQPRLARRADLA